MKNLRNRTLFHINIILNETECSITLCMREWYKRIVQITHLNANTDDKEILGLKIATFQNYLMPVLESR